MREKQYSFFKSVSPSFGGESQKGKRKCQRPLNPKSSIHLVLKSTRATGVWSLLHRQHKTRVHDLLIKIAQQNGIKVYQYANVGNHLHLLLKMRNRAGFQKFLRIFSGRVALMITQAKKGKAQGKFWDSLAFTRIVHWGKDFTRITRYFFKNEIEALGFSAGFAKKLVGSGQIFLNSG